MTCNALDSGYDAHSFPLLRDRLNSRAFRYSNASVSKTSGSGATRLRLEHPATSARRDDRLERAGWSGCTDPIGSAGSLGPTC